MGEGIARTRARVYCDGVCVFLTINDTGIHKLRISLIFIYYYRKMY